MGCSHRVSRRALCAGNDLSEEVTPIQAGLAWTVGKRRREAFDFLGGQVGRRAGGVV